MMPVIKGVESTLRQIVVYSYILVMVSFLYSLDSGHWFYTIIAIILGAGFIFKAHVAQKSKNDAHIWGLFKFSIYYLFGLFSAMVIDKIILG